MKEKIEQPKLDVQEVVSNLMEQEPETVVVCGKKHRIGWLKKRTVRKFSHIMVKDKDPWRRNVKVCACILLNNKHGLVTWFLLWAWCWGYWLCLFFVREIAQVGVMGVLDPSKKKIQSEPLAMATILAIGMMDLMMNMAKHEVTQAEQHGEQPTR